MDCAFGYLSDTLCAAPTGRAADRLPQGGPPPPARLFSFCDPEARPLGFIDTGDLGQIFFRKRLRGLVLQKNLVISIFSFSENGRRTRCFGKALWASWETPGSSRADFEPC